MGALALTLALAAIFALPPAAGAGADFAIKTLITQGDLAPSGQPLSRFGQVRLNRHGDILFEADVGTRRGLFLASGGRIVAVAIQGETTPIGGRYLELSYLAFNDRRDVAFIATIDRDQSERREPREAVLLLRDGKIEVVAKVRDAAPPSGFFSMFRDLALDDAGRLGFAASLSESDRPGGLFTLDSNGTRRVVAVLDPAPIGGAFRELSSPTLASDGSVAFHATVVHTTLRDGLFVVRGSRLEKVVATGDQSPLGGTFTQLANPVLDGDTILYFWGKVAEGRFPAGLFVADGREIRSVASRGAPGSAGRRYSYLGIDFSAAAGAAFQANLEGEGPNAAIFLWRPKGVKVVVSAGEASPTGGVFTHFGDPCLNSRGEVAFTGSVAGGVEGIHLAVPGSGK